MASDFKFKCDSEIECSKSCCKQVDLFLTPYDVQMMKNALGISSREFLDKYTSIIVGDVGLPLIFVNMKDDEESSCPFLSEKGCEIYEGRPGLCRLYPLEPSGENIKIVNRPDCPGFNKGKEWNVKKWKKKQGLGKYDEMDAMFKEITLDDKLLSGFDLNNTHVISLFLMAYDLDNFKKFVYETKFLKVFDLDEEEVESMRNDDLELLKFSFKWLKFGLLDRKTLKPKESIRTAKENESE